MANNVLLITVDSLRYSTLAEVNNKKIAPNAISLTRSGTDFTQAIANGPNTPSSFPSILTGTHPLLYGGYQYLNEDRPFLSELLRDSGYTTVGYHSNPHLGPEKNYNYGFDIFNDGEEERDDANTIINFVDERLDSDSQIYSILRRLWHVLGSATGASAYERAESITDNAIDWFSEWGGEQFFMWIHYMDVHYPFQPPNEHLEAIGHNPIAARRVASLNDAFQESPNSLTDEDIADLRALYRGELHYVDSNIGRIIDALSERGVRNDTMIVFTADHGEAFGEHNRWGHHPYMYDELLRVPLIVDQPDREPGTIDTQVSLIDLVPTICDVFGIEQPEELQGENLFEKDDGVELATSMGGERLVARTPEWKCLWHVPDDKVELYKPDSDPGETTDVSDEHPDVVSRLKGEMQDYRDEARSKDIELPEVEESEAVKQRLRDLGYKN